MLAQDEEDLITSLKLLKSWAGLVWALLDEYPNSPDGEKTDLELAVAKEILLRRGLLHAPDNYPCTNHPCDHDSC